MAERGRKLTKASITNLRRTMSDVEQLKARIRLGSERSSETRRAAAHYIVETPSGGIPAATGSPPNPGSAECTIFWRNGDPKEVSTTNRTVTVYNYTSTLIPGATLVMVHRDGWGDLWVVPSDIECGIGLAPGSYPGVAGATIAGGATGTIVYDGKTYQARNQSSCSVSAGDLIGFHVSPECQAFFVPCICCTPPSDPDPTCTITYPCCKQPFAYCLRIPFMDTPGFQQKYLGTASLKDTSWTIPAPLESPFTIVCNGQQIFLSFTMTCCDDGDPDVTWSATDVDDVELASGSFNVGGLCASPATIERHTLSLPGDCDMFISFGTAFSDELCGDPDPPPVDCCSQSLYFCLNGDSQLLAVNGGNYTWDVSACCGATASLEITLSCTAGVISMSWQYTAGAVFDAGAVNISEFCTDGSPRIYDFPGITCFLQMLVSVVQFECAACSGGPTGTTPPGP